MSTEPDHATVEIVAAVLANAEVIVSAYNHVGDHPATGFALAACCAMAEEESGGEHIWGHDAWDPIAYPRGKALPIELEGKPVHERDYIIYKRLRNNGLQPQGCGITQLTSAGYQEDAEHAGGCWVPFFNARTGFAILKGLFAREGNPTAGFAAYNGSGAAALAYGERVEALRVGWAQRLAKPAA